MMSWRISNKRGRLSAEYVLKMNSVSGTSGTSLHQNKRQSLSMFNNSLIADKHLLKYG